MLVGVPKEIKDSEYRVGLVPSTVRELTAKGHGVLVETRAGIGAGLSDAEYEAAGAKIVPSSAETAHTPVSSPSPASGAVPPVGPPTALTPLKRPRPAVAFRSTFGQRSALVKP